MKVGRHEQTLDIMNRRYQEYLWNIFQRRSSSSSSSVPKGVGDRVPPLLSVLRLCDKIHCSLFSCPFSDAVKNLFSWSPLRSFSQNSRRCYQVFQFLSSHGVSKKFAYCILISLLSVNFLLSCYFRRNVCYVIKIMR